MRRWLITGGSGFIGRRVVRLLEEMGEEVHTVGFTPGSLVHAPTNHYADLLDRESASRLMELVRPSHIVTLAWTTEHGKFWADPRNEDWRAATTALIEQFLARGGEVVVGVGSCAEYAWDGRACREDSTPIDPATPYGRAKAALMRALEHECARAGARLAWGRIFFAYGAGEPEARLIPSLVRAACSDQVIRIREPHRRLDFVHADDVARALIVLGMDGASGAFNIASGSPIAVAALAHMIARSAGKAAHVEDEEAQAAAPDVTADVARLRSLGWEPRTDLFSGITEAINAIAK